MALYSGRDGNIIKAVTVLKEDLFRFSALPASKLPKLGMEPCSGCADDSEMSTAESECEISLCTLRSKHSKSQLSHCRRSPLRRGKTNGPPHTGS